MRKRCIESDPRGMIFEGEMYEVEHVEYPYENDYRVFLPDGRVTYMKKKRFKK